MKDLESQLKEVIEVPADYQARQAELSARESELKGNYESLQRQHDELREQLAELEKRQESAKAEYFAVQGEKEAFDREVSEYKEQQNGGAEKVIISSLKEFIQLNLSKRHETRFSRRNEGSFANHEML